MRLACKLFGLFIILASQSACVPSSQSVLSAEIIAGSNGVVGQRVEILKSDLVESGSMLHMSVLLNEDFWSSTDVKICENEKLPKGVPMLFGGNGEVLHAFEGQNEGGTENDPIVYNFIVCAVQLDNPPQISAIGYIATKQKYAPLR